VTKIFDIGALNFYPIFIPLFERKVSDVSPAAGLKSGQSNQKKTTIL
jgi:hypothetical protein